jgi:hypothetical protein
MKTKAKIDFSGYPAGELGGIALNIKVQLTLNAGLFPSLPYPVATTLGPAIDTFNEKLAAKESRATADIIAFNVARHELESLLTDYGNAVNLTAKGDPSIVVASGFPSYETSRPADPSPPAAPTGLRLVPGDVSGEAIARFHAPRAASISEVQTNTADPNNEASWHFAGMFNGGKAVLGGLAPGTVLWVRVRTAGIKGVMGAWSDPAKIMVV